MISTLQWLLREGGFVLQWWWLITLAGIAVLPLTLSWLRNLPDRGVLLARSLGLLLIGGVFWLLVNFGLLANDAGSIALCWLFVLVGSLVSSSYGNQQGEESWGKWWRKHKLALFCGEILFLILLFGWALVRAQIQELASTEKPMELMMQSSINNSTYFPPNDAWLSGHSLSYYYFGYLLSASLAKLSGVANAVAFNLTSAAWFGLSGITIYGVSYNLIRWRKNERSQPSGWRQGLSFVFGALLAVHFALWLSNGHYPIIELPFQRGWASPEYLRFFDAKDRCEGSGTKYWWWFGAARTIVDRSPGYANDCDPAFHSEVIDEFPAFSFLLGDNHPHVYGIPFAALLMALAWHRLTSSGPPRTRDTLLYGFCLSAQLCTNIWDAPIYFVLLVAAEGLRIWRRAARSNGGFLQFRGLLIFTIQLGILILFFASPLLLTIRTQARGILPNLDHPTRIQQLLVMFAPFVTLLLAFFLRINRRSVNSRESWRLAGILTIFLLFTLSLFSIALAFLTKTGTVSDAVGSFFARRGQPTHLLSTVSLTVIMFFFISHLLRNQYPKIARDFAILLALIGIVLVLIPEFVYLHDLFGTRMNTIFKLYYQAWLMFAIAAAYGCHKALSSSKSDRIVPGSALILVIAFGSFYLPSGIMSRMKETRTREITLDGVDTIMSATDRALSECLMERLAGRPIVIAEGIPGADKRRSYNVSYGRIATTTGLPSVIAWEPHQSQWRGTSYSSTVGSRPNDIDILYRTNDHLLMHEIIRRYGIDYIIWGVEEQLTYGAAAEGKFADRLSEFCLQDLARGRSLAYATGYQREN